ncbi:MAG: DUF3427 domain-containing protein [Planctomycetes bacterium]|nr:DUF3427 domain-containing protein [Planctomycetota bacterium]
MAEIPRGLYERVLDLATHSLVHELAAEHHDLGDSEAGRRLARAVYDFLERALADVKGDDQVDAQLRICNRILDVLIAELPRFARSDDHLTRTLLTAVGPESASRRSPRPSVPLSESALFVNANRERSFQSELRLEIASSDSVDFLCPFLFWQGYVGIRNEIAKLRERGGRLRVLTSTYGGMTQARVLDDLVELGAEVKVSYEQRSTRLHAKSWYFQRDSGFSTAFVGSSNLSQVALTSGLEWNVRLSEIENRATLEEFRGAYENYWNHPDFRDYAREEFARGIAIVRRNDDRIEHTFAIRPFTYQQAVLDRLTAEREVHDRHANLIVAATGTGKTVVAALDYARMGRPRPSLLFVAHRKEILEQACATYRHAVGDGSFGEYLVDGQTPREWTQVFASVQALARRDVASWPRDRFDVVVVDEVHHAARRNETYGRLLDHLQPRELLGLTATPERADGSTITDWFGGRIAAELRLWDAIDRGLLVPFQYFAVHDGVDLRDVSWRGGRYDPRELDDLYDGNDARAHLILAAVRHHVEDPTTMRALGFCAGVSHARYMTRAFQRAGLPAACVLGTTDKADRRDAIRRLAAGELKAIFCVDVFNEGIDIKAVDTILFLRPTESGLLFAQQLGRGLRHAEGKRCLTALDFVGHAHRRFRYDLKYRAITRGSRRELRDQVEDGFPYLPAGCSIQLDRVSRELILENLRQGIGSGRRGLLAELADLGPATTLAGFLESCDLELGDLYRGGRTFTELRRALRFEPEPAGPDEAALARAIGRLLHVDDRRRLTAWRALVRGDEAVDAQPRLAMMLATALDRSAAVDPGRAIGSLRSHRALGREFLELLDLLETRLDHRTPAFVHESGVPLALHARYALHEIMAAFGDVRNGRLYEPREGVVFHGSSRCNLLFVTLTKDEDDYSPTTMYRDFALAPNLFHWQSQSRTRVDSEKGRRHTEHAARGITPLLFIRVRKKDDRGETMPYSFVGPVRFQRSRGERPMNIEWELDHPMPAALFEAAAVAAS